jgi:hypothetical protein
MAAIFIQNRIRQQQGGDRPHMEDQSKITELRDETFDTIIAKKEKMKIIRKLRSSLRINDTFAAAIGMFGMCLGVWEYEFYYLDLDGKPHFTSDQMCYALRALVTLTSVCLAGLVTVHSYIAYKIEREKKPAELVQSYWKSSHFKLLFGELIICLTHCPPGIDITFSVQQLGADLVYSVDTFTTQILFCRFYLLCRGWAHFSKWTSEMAEECCDPEGCEAGTIFALKASFKDSAYLTLTIAMAISIGVFGLAARAFERPYYYGWDSSTSGFQDYDFFLEWYVVYRYHHVHSRLWRFFCKNTYGQIYSYISMLLGSISCIYDGSNTDNFLNI